MEVDSGETYITISGLSAASEDYTIYLELENVTPGNKDPGLVPDKLEAKAATAAAWAALTHTPRNRYFRIGYVYRNPALSIRKLFDVYRSVFVFQIVRHSITC